MPYPDTPRQITVEEFEAGLAERMSLISSGTVTAEFFLGYTSRDPETKILGLKKDVSITADDAALYLPHLAKVEDSNTTVSGSPIEGVDLSPQANFSVTPTELSTFRIVLEALARPSA